MMQTTEYDAMRDERVWRDEQGVVHRASEWAMQPSYPTPVTRKRKNDKCRLDMLDKRIAENQRFIRLCYGGAVFFGALAAIGATFA